MGATWCRRHERGAPRPGGSNLAADPAVRAGDRDGVPGDATIIAGGPDRDRLWDDHVAALPWFADYPNQVGERVIRWTADPKA